MVGYWRESFFSQSFKTGVMDSLTTILAIVLPALGWGGLVVPSRLRASLGGGWGSRLLMGMGVLTVLLYVFNVILGVPLGLIARLSAGLGLALFGASLFRDRARLSWRAALSHPVPVFCLLLIVLALWQGPETYIPYAWDEYTNWLGASKQIFFEDTLLSPAMHYPHQEYPPGWRLIVIYPALVLGRYDDYFTLFTVSVMHFGFLGMVFEVTGEMLKNRSGWPGKTRRLISWAIMLCLILAESTWKLIPQDVLIERPQIYLFTAGILVAILASERKTDRLALAGCLGLVMGFGFIVKSSMIVFLPALVLIGGYLVFLEISPSRKTAAPTARQLGNGVLMIALLVLPFVAAYLSWDTLKTGSRCNSSLLQLLQPASLAMILSDQAGRIGADYLAAIFDYLLIYKSPLTGVAVLSLGWALGDRKWRLAVISLGVFIGFYALALYWNYLVCADWFNDYLSSLQRYIRVPLRSVHLVGLLFGLTAAVLMVPGLSGTRPRFAGLEKNFTAALPAAVLVLMALTVWQAHASLRETHQRNNEPYLAGRVAMVQDQLPALISLISKKAVVGPNILMISMAEDEFDTLVARHFTIAVDPARPLRPYAFSSLQFRKGGLAHGNAPATLGDLKSIFEKSNIIWPLDGDPVLRDTLLAMTGDAACAETPTDYFIVADPNDRGSYSCERK